MLSPAEFRTQITGIQALPYYALANPFFYEMFEPLAPFTLFTMIRVSGNS